MLSGFEKIFDNGIATYFAINYNFATSHIVKFNQNWIYLNYYNLTYNGTHSTKYVGGFFYFSSNDFFYKTDSSFVLINSNHKIGAGYRQSAYDLSSSKFYVAAYWIHKIDVFDTSCSLLQSINLNDNKPFGLALYNGYIYAGILQNSTINNDQIIVLKNGIVTKKLTVRHCIPSRGISSITVDSFGYMAISCGTIVTLYDSNINEHEMNFNISTSESPRTTAIDSNGRFIVMAQKTLDIYY